MKITAIIILVILSFKGFSQNKFDFGIETGLCYLKVFHQGTDFTQETVLDIQFKNYELAIGYSATDFFRYKWRPYNVKGIIIGTRYHLQNKNRLSHFVFGVNFQSRRYYNPIGTSPINLRSDVSGYSFNDILYEGHTTNLHFTAGFETIFWQRFAFIARTGIGITHHNLNLTQYGIDEGYTDPEIWEASPYLNLALRVYVKKQRRKGEVST